MLFRSKISDIINKYTDEIVGKHVYETFGNKFPLLIKFIDASNDLSIQVHPDDDLSKKRHNSFGKTEMWYVVKARQGAGLYSGFSKQITPQEYVERVENNTFMDVLKRYEVEAGDGSKKKKKKKRKKKKEVQQEMTSKEDEGQEMKECADSDTAMTSVEESNSSVQPFTSTTENLTLPKRWRQHSQRWRPKLEKLANIDASKVYRLGSLTIGVGPEFQIGRASCRERVASPV